jgi:hypothetical protein
VVLRQRSTEIYCNWSSPVRKRGRRREDLGLGLGRGETTEEEEEVAWIVEKVGAFGVNMWRTREGDRERGTCEREQPTASGCDVLLYSPGHFRVGEWQWQFFFFWKTRGGEEEIKSNQVWKNNLKRRGRGGCGSESLGHFWSWYFFTFGFDETNPDFFTFSFWILFFSF